MVHIYHTYEKSNTILAYLHIIFERMVVGGDCVVNYGTIGELYLTTAVLRIIRLRNKKLPSYSLYHNLHVLDMIHRTDIRNQSARRVSFSVSMAVSFSCLVSCLCMFGLPEILAFSQDSLERKRIRTETFRIGSHGIEDRSEMLLSFNTTRLEITWNSG